MSLAELTAATDDPRLLDAARSVFGRDGFAAADLAMIAEAAGLSQEELLTLFPDKKALFTAVLVCQQQAFDAHCREASSGLLGEPMDLFLAGCRAALEFGGQREYAQIVRIDGPVVLGEDDWFKIDQGLGLPTVQRGLRNLAPTATEAAVRPMALMIMGAMNELILALARGDSQVGVDDSVAVLERLLRAWAVR